MALSRNNPLFGKPVRYSSLSCIQSRYSKPIGHHSRGTRNLTPASRQLPSRSMHLPLQWSVGPFHAQIKLRVNQERPVCFYNSYASVTFLLLRNMCNGCSNITRQSLGTFTNRFNVAKGYLRYFTLRQAQQELAD